MSAQRYDEMIDTYGGDEFDEIFYGGDELLSDVKLPDNIESPKSRPDNVESPESQPDDVKLRKKPQKYPPEDLGDWIESAQETKEISGGEKRTRHVETGEDIELTAQLMREMIDELTK